ncbi:hypothetical protein JBW_00994 [Pelosinus fermentans JBW45]|uniref:Uncharacterized protein n=1 Tax=Pelosinus fermentans JBW45 TaxID=1192197 RepID=I9NT47_9FIRM|nr:hypothetical protein JBW_00994 [Pelosinus fermentans JBW45]
MIFHSISKYAIHIKDKSFNLIINKARLAAVAYGQVYHNHSFSQCPTNHNPEQNHLSVSLRTVTQGKNIAR